MLNQLLKVNLGIQKGHIIINYLLFWQNLWNSWREFIIISETSDFWIWKLNWKLNPFLGIFEITQFHFYLCFDTIKLQFFWKRMMEHILNMIACKEIKSFKWFISFHVFMSISAWRINKVVVYVCQWCFWNSDASFFQFLKVHKDL